jgi:hypothetical protein
MNWHRRQHLVLFSSNLARVGNQSVVLRQRGLEEASIASLLPRLSEVQVLHSTVFGQFANHHTVVESSEYFFTTYSLPLPLVPLMFFRARR